MYCIVILYFWLPCVVSTFVLVRLELGWSGWPNSSQSLYQNHIFFTLLVKKKCIANNSLLERLLSVLKKRKKIYGCYSRLIIGWIICLSTLVNNRDVCLRDQKLPNHFCHKLSIHNPEHEQSSPTSSCFSRVPHSIFQLFALLVGAGSGFWNTT